MTVSVIIPTKNRFQDLMKAIDSISKQSRPPEQLVLVDQSAEPIPESILASFRGRLPTSSELKYVYNTENKSHKEQTLHGRVLCESLYNRFRAIDTDVVAVLQRTHYPSRTKTGRLNPSTG